jgi:citrate lyase subunit beta/citryl-CoA lyase
VPLVADPAGALMSDQMTPPLRTILFAPGNDARKASRALQAPASAACLDLEDAVAPTEKEAARRTVVELLRDQPAAGQVAVRVNAVATGLVDDDLRALVPVLGRLDLIVVPMVAGPDDLRHVADRLDALEHDAGVRAGRVRLLATVETAAGVLAAPVVASATPRLRTLVFGPADLAHDLGVELTAEGEELRYARSAVVVAARAAGLEAAVDGPHVNVADDEGCRIGAEWSRKLGFQGKLVIHPRQIAIVQEVYAPAPEAVEHARSIVAAYDEALARGVASIRLDDGTFIDEPVAARARTVLAEAGQAVGT